MSPQDTVYVPQVSGEAIDNDDVTVSDEVAVLLEANPNRKSALIINTGPEDMRVTTDGSDPTPTHGKPIGAGESLILTMPFCPAGPVKAVRQGATDTAANASEVN
jgi:hypothetical protein